jgi:hypothetical protein
MTRVLQEMYRVLKPKKAAVIVVATSIMRDVDTETQTCLVEIGKKLGFEASPIGVRQLDRNRRMLPAGMEINRGSQIQQRMHEEYVLGFYKPLQVRSGTSLWVLLSYVANIMVAYVKILFGPSRKRAITPILLMATTP